MREPPSNPRRSHAPVKCATRLIGKPIAGAKLTIRKLDQPNGILLKQFTAETNADGKYTIELPTDHPWQQTRTIGLGRRKRSISFHWTWKLIAAVMHPFIDCGSWN